MESSGRWTRLEHEEFLRCLAIHGREWKKVSLQIPTRTATQIRSHAQKYFKKINKTENNHEHSHIAAPRSRRRTVQEAVGEIDDKLEALRKKKKTLTRSNDELVALEMLCGAVS